MVCFTPVFCFPYCMQSCHCFLCQSIKTGCVLVSGDVAHSLHCCLENKKVMSLISLMQHKFVFWNTGVLLKLPAAFAICSLTGAATSMGGCACMVLGGLFAPDPGDQAESPLAVCWATSIQITDSTLIVMLLHNIIT